MNSKFHEGSSAAYQLLKRLFPICRSITGLGIKQSLEIIAENVDLVIKKVPSGTLAFDWQVPKEWVVKDAYIHDESGRSIVDFKNNNLHLMGYSHPVDGWFELEELDKHLYSLEELPEAIPYITSYYNQAWGFCLSHSVRKKLKKSRYYVKIDTSFIDGNLYYGEILIRGRLDKEVFLSSYLCHPSMANNELSGPCILTRIASWLLSLQNRYSYRIVIIPETIGSIVYISKHLETMKKNIVAGFNLSCLGDERGYSYISSRNGNTAADKVIEYVASTGEYAPIKKWSFLKRGGDERQYCAPGIDLPVVTLCRSKFGDYPEYHSSLDNLNLVTEKGLDDGYRYVRTCLEIIEKNAVYQGTVLCEPKLSKYNLYQGISSRSSYDDLARITSDFLAYADGKTDLLEISRTIGVPFFQLLDYVKLLEGKNLIKSVERIAPVSPKSAFKSGVLRGNPSRKL